MLLDGTYFSVSGSKYMSHSFTLVSLFLFLFPSFWKADIVSVIRKKFQFVIPKKKSKEEPAVDKDKIALFLKKKEEEKRKAVIEKKKQKEELIKLRLQSYGGKVCIRIFLHVSLPQT